jgi:peptidoglycan hydrolase CwlO-like protein
MQALDEGRRRALMEQRMTDRALAHDKERLELRSHVLTLREGELDSRLRDRERQYASLEIQLRELTVLMRKAEAGRDAQARRVASLEEELSVMRHSRSKPRRQSPAKARRVAVARRPVKRQKAISRKRPR